MAEIVRGYRETVGGSIIDSRGVEVVRICVENLTTAQAVKITGAIVAALNIPVQLGGAGYPASITPPPAAPVPLSE